MNFDDFKRINKNKRVNWFMMHIPKPIINHAYHDLKLAEISENRRYVQIDADKFNIVPKSISNYYRLKYKRAIHSKVKVPISFSEMDHYM